MNIDENKINVVYNGLGKHYGAVEKSNLEKPYFIYVGSLHKRKNIKRMLLAFNNLKQEYKEPLDFIIVGDYLWNKEEKFENINKDIHFYINENRVDENNLEQEIGNLVKGTEEPAIILHADKTVDIEHVVTVMDIAYRNKYKIVLAVKP